jgi:hypothetical protein
LLDELISQGRYGTFLRKLDEVSQRDPLLVVWNFDTLRWTHALRDSRQDKSVGKNQISPTHLQMASHSRYHEADEDEFVINGSTEWLADVFFRVKPALRERLVDSVRSRIGSGPTQMSWKETKERLAPRPSSRHRHNDYHDREASLRSEAIERLKAGSLNAYRRYLDFLSDADEGNEYREEFYCAAAFGGSIECFVEVTEDRLDEIGPSVLVDAVKGKAWSLIEHVLTFPDFDVMFEGDYFNDADEFFGSVAEAGNIKILDIIYQKFVSQPPSSNFDLNAIGEGGARHGHIDVLEWARAKGNSISLLSPSTWEQAAGFGQLGVLQWGKKNISEFASSIPSAWKSAASGGWIYILDWMWQNSRRAALEESLQEVLSAAISNGHFPILRWVEDRVRSLVRARGDPDHEGLFRRCISSALESIDPKVFKKATTKGHIEVLQWLHAHGLPSAHFSDALTSAYPEVHAWAKSVQLPGWDAVSALEAAVEHDFPVRARWIFNALTPSPPGPGSEVGRHLCHKIATASQSDQELLETALAVGFPWDDCIDSFDEVLGRAHSKFVNKQEVVSMLLERLPNRADVRVCASLVKHGFENLLRRARELGFPWSPERGLDLHTANRIKILSMPDLVLHHADAGRVLAACAPFFSFKQFVLGLQHPWFREHASEDERSIAAGVASAHYTGDTMITGYITTKVAYRTYLAELSKLASSGLQPHQLKQLVGLLEARKSDLDWILEEQESHAAVCYAMKHNRQLFVSVLEFKPSFLCHLSSDAVTELALVAEREMILPAQVAKAFLLLPNARNCQELIFKIAVQSGDVEFVRSILADPRFDPAASGFEWVVHACETGDAAMLHCVLDHPDLSEALRSCYTQLLSKACAKPSLEIVSTLLDHPAVDPNYQSGITLKQALKKQDTELCKILLNHPRVDPSVDNQSILLWACRLDSEWPLRHLLRHPKVDPAVDNQAALSLACKEGKVECMQILLKDCRVDPTVNDQLLLRAACEGRGKKAADVARLLLGHSRTRFVPIARPIFQDAIRRDAVDIVALLSQDPRIFDCISRERFDDEFFTSLGAFANIPMLQALKPMRRAFPDSQSHLILLKACELGCLDVARLLINDWQLDAGFNNQACLLQAIAAKQTAVIAFLLTTRKVDPSVASTELCTLASTATEMESALFLEHPRTQSFGQSGFQLLMGAMHKRNSSLFRRLLWDRRMHSSAGFQALLKEAFARKLDEFVDILLADMRVDPVGTDYELLRSLCANNSFEMVRVYLRHYRVQIPAEVLENLLRNAVESQQVLLMSALLTAIPDGLVKMDTMRVMHALASSFEFGHVLNMLNNDSIILPPDLCAELLQAVCEKGQLNTAGLPLTALTGHPTFSLSTSAFHEKGLMVAVKQCHVKLVSTLLQDPRADASLCDHALLRTALSYRRHNSVPLVEAILPYSLRSAFRGGDAGAVARLCLDWLRQSAVGNEDTEVVNAFVKNGAFRAVLLASCSNGLRELYVESRRLDLPVDISAILLELCVMGAVEAGDMHRVHSLVRDATGDPVFPYILKPFPWLADSVMVNRLLLAARGETNEALGLDQPGSLDSGLLIDAPKTIVSSLDVVGPASSMGATPAGSSMNSSSLPTASLASARSPHPARESGTFYIFDVSTELDCHRQDRTFFS